MNEEIFDQNTTFVEGGGVMQPQEVGVEDGGFMQPQEVGVEDGGFMQPQEVGVEDGGFMQPQEVGVEDGGFMQPQGFGEVDGEFVQPEGVEQGNGEFMQAQVDVVGPQDMGLSENPGFIEGQQVQFNQIGQQNGPNLLVLEEDQIVFDGQTAVMTEKVLIIEPSNQNPFENQFESQSYGNEQNFEAISPVTQDGNEIIIEEIED